MPRYILTAVEHEETGYKGLVPSQNLDWAQSSNSLYIPGVTRIAHDLLDHCGKKETGSLEEELAALGGYMWRSEFYLMDENRDRFTTFFTDLLTTFSDSMWQHVRKCPYKVRVKPDDMREINTLIMRIKERFGAYYEAAKNNDEHDMDISFREWWGLNKKDIIDWIRYGFRRSQKKYPFKDSYDFFQFSKKFDKEFEEFCNLYSDDIDNYYGFTAKLKIDFRYWEIEFTANEIDYAGSNY